MEEKIKTFTLKNLIDLANLYKKLTSDNQNTTSILNASKLLLLLKTFVENQYIMSQLNDYYKILNKYEHKINTIKIKHAETDEKGFLLLDENKNYIYTKEQLIQLQNELNDVMNDMTTELSKLLSTNVDIPIDILPSITPEQLSTYIENFKNIITADDVLLLQIFFC